MYTTFSPCHPVIEWGLAVTLEGDIGAANEWIEGSDTVFHKLTVFIFSDYPLYAFAAVLLVVAVVLMPLAVVSKIW